MDFWHEASDGAHTSEVGEAVEVTRVCQDGNGEDREAPRVDERQLVRLCADQLTDTRRIGRQGTFMRQNNDGA